MNVLEAAIDTATFAERARITELMLSYEAQLLAQQAALVKEGLHSSTTDAQLDVLRLLIAAISK